MTPRQANLLDFIDAHQRFHNGVAPSFEQMREGIGAASKSTISRLLLGLEADGRIRRRRNRARAITVVPDFAAMSTEELLAELCVVVAEVHRRGLLPPEGALLS